MKAEEERATSESSEMKSGPCYGVFSLEEQRKKEQESSRLIPSGINLGRGWWDEDQPDS